MSWYEQLKNLIKKIPGTARTHHAMTCASRKALYALRGGTRYRNSYSHPVLAGILGDKERRSYTSDHLNSLFFFALDAKPGLMVELGTNKGESTRALLAAASLNGSTLLSIDIKDCSRLDLPFKEHWHFVQSDDIEFGKTRFTEWCHSTSLGPGIELLFIDTSHWYEHTKKEFAVWIPYLSEGGIMILHDTNMGSGVYGRMDGSVDIGFDNKRGVIRALEELVGRQYDEKSFFCDLAGGYLIMHYPHCNGLTVLKKQKTAG